MLRNKEGTLLLLSRWVRVTESEEVRQRLGNTEGNDNFVVNKIEDTVGSMLGGTNKNGDEHQSAATGEHRRLQEAGN